jgi:hypothetical protein
MAHPERPALLTRLKLMEAFGFVGEEDYWSRVSHDRLNQILADEQTTIHEVTLDYNNYGGFLFVCVSRPVAERRACVTFFGLGFHEQRERWLVDTWSWYTANTFPERLKMVVPREEAQKLIAERRAEIIRYVGTEEPRSRQAALFEYLADLTDDDAASIELEDFGGSLPWLDDDPAE